jgi:hypothetical protein
VLRFVVLADALRRIGQHFRWVARGRRLGAAKDADREREKNWPHEPSLADVLASERASARAGSSPLDHLALRASVGFRGQARLRAGWSPLDAGTIEPSTSGRRRRIYKRVNVILLSLAVGLLLFMFSQGLRLRFADLSSFSPATLGRAFLAVDVIVPLVAVVVVGWLRPPTPVMGCLALMAASPMAAFGLGHVAKSAEMRRKWTGIYSFCWRARW